VKPRISGPLLLFILVITGCSKAVLRADSDPNTNLGLLKTFHVRKFSEDSRGLDKIIAKTLNGYGFKATDGPESIPPTPVDALVTYKDRWMWDMTMYLLELNIELRNPETNFMFASGNSYRTSLVRKSPKKWLMKSCVKFSRASWNCRKQHQRFPRKINDEICMVYFNCFVCGKLRSRKQI
jgi:hypothetical protein